MAEKKTETVEVQKNPWLKETRNLTEQAAILKADPKLAQRMQAAAARDEEQARQNAASGNAELPERLPKGIAVTNASGRKKRTHRWLP
jgi:hypothetical protein